MALFTEPHGDKIPKNLVLLTQKNFLKNKFFRPGETLKWDFPESVRAGLE